MPRGARQTTGTAQALLGAKQIAAGERASKRATVADYVKTGVGALKSVGDYLQQKQSLEQSQDKLNLEQSMFSAEYGDEGEQGRKRKQEEELRLANTAVAQGTIDARIKAAEAGARKLETEAEKGEKTLEDEVTSLSLDVKRKGFEAKTAEVISSLARLRETSSIDNVIAHTELLDQQMKKLISGEKNEDTRLALEERRVKIAEVHGRAVLDKMEKDGTLAEKDFNLLKEKWEKTKDPVKREAMLSDYDKRLREAQLKEVEARPGQLKSAQELQELQKGPLREAAAKSIERQRKGLTEAQTESIDAAKVVVTNTMEEHPHLRDLGVGANEELGELNREGPNFRLLSALTNLHRDGIVTLDELRPHSLTSGTKEGGGWAAGAGTKGDAAFKNLGNTWHHLGVGDRPALVKHLAKTWKKGPAALDEAAKHIEDNWSSIVAGHMKGSPMQNLGVLLGTRETHPAAGANIKRSFFKGLADAMRSVSEGVEPESFYRFEIQGNILSEIGLKNPVERPRINVPQ